jgi:hypothetical protein
MSTNNPYSPGPEGADQVPPKHGRGCCFWGCLLAVAMLLLLMVGIGGTAYFGYRWLIAKALEYTDDSPMEMPALALDEEQQQAVQQRWESFQESLKAGQGDTLELTDEELNALLQTNDKVAGRIHVEIQDDRLRGRVSLPLDALGIKPLRGRYFNAEASFEVALVGQQLVVHMQEAQVKGEPVPEEFMAQLRRENLAKEFGREPEQAEMLRKFESIEVRDGKIILRSRETTPAAAERTEPEQADDDVPP